MSAKVSVITLVYNGMDVIFETIDSVLQQDYEEIELIIADDCSRYFDTILVSDYIKKHKTSNINNYIVYQNEVNMGTVKNINNAIRKASGDILINLSAGDIFFSNKTVSEIVLEFNNNNYNLLCTRRAFFRDNIQEIECYMPNDYEIKQIEKMKNSQTQYESFYSGNTYNMASGSALSYRKKYIESLNYFDEKYVLWEDGPFFVKSIKRDGMLTYNYMMTTIYYRYGGVSTGKMSPVMKKDALLFCEEGLNDPNLSFGTKRALKYRYKKIMHFDNWTIINRIKYGVLYADVIIRKAVRKLHYIFC